MRLIADSGSTKTAWCLLADKQVVRRMTTEGFNPYFETEGEIGGKLAKLLLPHLPERGDIADIHFYGAGCTEEKAPLMARALQQQVGHGVRVEVCSDMLGAARALCGRGAGIACILGTGSNSCQYDGGAIVKQVPPLGFILGDEGSGAALGKALVGDLLKNQLREELKQEFMAKYHLTAADIIERVYRQPYPNRFLAGLQPFLREHLDDEAVYALVLECFGRFFARNVLQYDYRHLPVHFTGSIAYAYRGVLEEAAAKAGVRMAGIEKSPLEGLIRYYQDI